jgi:hypothetical protein
MSTSEPITIKEMLVGIKPYTGNPTELEAF